MSAVGFRVKGKVGLEQIKADLDDWFDLGKFQEIMQKASKIAYDEACRLCPVADARYIDSGMMRAAIVVTYDGYLTYSLECNVPYASFNEYGWRGIPRVPQPPHTRLYLGGYRPFMRIGLLKAEEYLNKELEDALYRHGAKPLTSTYSKPKMKRTSWT